jgi:AAHS family 4-hydroxybenzoate transporter-like MFS transporter
MERAGTINIAETVDSSRVGGFQIGIFALCAACLIMDGFDVQIIGVVAPEVVGEFTLSPGQMGWITTAGLVGILVGAFLFSLLGDRIGRRPVLVTATLYFAALTLATGFTTSFTQFAVLRFFGGIGLGGIMPNLVALVGEYSPKRSRVFISMLIQNGFNIGAMLVGFAALFLIPNYGWRSVFYVGGAIPLVIGTLMLVLLPESLQFLALRRKGDARLGKWLERVDPSVQITPATQFVVPERPAHSASVGELFRSGRSTGTTLLWVMNFMNLVVLYFLSQWLPIVFRNAGMSQANAIWVATTLQGGGVVGTLLLGWLISKYGYIRVLTTSFSIGCIAVALIGQPLALGLLFPVVFVAGHCIIGSQAGLNSLAAAFYPTDVRSTGIGSALGTGRLGAIAGQPVAASLLARGWTPSALLLLTAVPAAITAASVFAMRRQVKPQGTPLAEPKRHSERSGHDER